MVTAPSAGAAPACTIKGTAGADRLKGTAGNDVICGLGGNDVILSGGGTEDILLGGVGDDRLEGGTTRFVLMEGGDGNDRLIGGTKSDAMRGGGGNDVMTGGDGSDSLRGGGGNDTMHGQGGNDAAYWDAGADAINGGAGTDSLSYSEAPKKVAITLDGLANDGTLGEGDNVGNDIERVGGSEYADTMTGNDGPNGLSGWEGKDLILGGGGADQIWGDTGNDELRGEAGDDTITGGDGIDLLIGGDGADILKGEGGNTQSSGGNACDADPADTRTKCTADNDGPDVWVTPSAIRIAPGEQVSFEVIVDEVAGTDEVLVTTTHDGGEVAWCSGPMAVVDRANNGGIFSAIKSCTAPGNAPTGGYEVVFSATDRLGFASEATRLHGFVVSTASETTAPVVDTVSTDASSYGPGDVIRVALDAADASGVQYVEIGVRPTAEDPWQSNSICVDYQSFRTGGSILDGTWTVVCELGATPPTGTFDIDLIAYDTYGNGQNLTDAGTITVTS